VDLELSEAAEWWPEYEIPIGVPVDPLAGDVTDMYDPSTQLFERAYSNGLVLVNPGSNAATRALSAPLGLAQPPGGGVVPDSGVPPASWRVDYTQVTSVHLQPGTAAILLADPDPHRLAVDPLVSGGRVALTATGGRPDVVTWFFATRSGVA